MDIEDVRSRFIDDWNATQVFHNVPRVLIERRPLRVRAIHNDRLSFEERVLPKLKEWLMKARSETQLDAGAGFQLLIEEDSPSFAIVTREPGVAGQFREEFRVGDERANLQSKSNP